MARYTKPIEVVPTLQLSDWPFTWTIDAMMPSNATRCVPRKK